MNSQMVRDAVLSLQPRHASSLLYIIDMNDTSTSAQYNKQSDSFEGRQSATEAEHLKLAAWLRPQVTNIAAVWRSEVHVPVFSCSHSAWDIRPEEMADAP